MHGSELEAFRHRLHIDRAELAAELGTTPTCLAMIETRKSVSTRTAAQYTSKAVELAKRDIAKHSLIKAELARMGNALLASSRAIK